MHPASTKNDLCPNAVRVTRKNVIELEADGEASGAMEECQAHCQTHPATNEKTELRQKRTKIRPARWKAVYAQDRASRATHKKNKPHFVYGSEPEAGDRGRRGVST